MHKFRSVSIAFLMTGTALCCTEHALNAIPYPSTFPLLGRQGELIVCDSRKKIPLWTQEHLTKKNIPGSSNCRHFRIDDIINFIRVQITTMPILVSVEGIWASC